MGVVLYIFSLLMVPAKSHVCSHISVLQPSKPLVPKHSYLSSTVCTCPIVSSIFD